MEENKKSYSSVVKQIQQRKSPFLVKPHNYINDNYNQDINNFFRINKDPEYQKKLELSYNKCIEELCNYEELEEELNRLKFIVDPNTGNQIKTYTFPLEKDDNLYIEDSTHSYVFKRSKFYLSFDKPKSFLKRDLISYWSQKRYFVRLIRLQNNNWGLQLSWN